MVCWFKAILGPGEISRLPYSIVPNYSAFDHSTGELHKTQVFEVENISVTVKTSSYGYIEGSLHYFKNGGRHNVDDFLMNDLWGAINRLNNYLNISIELLPLVQFEFGLNFVPSVSSSRILNALFLHQGMQFKGMFVKPGSHRVCHHSDYDIKVYDKRAQFQSIKLDQELVRLEIHANRARPINNLGLYRLIDLKNEMVVHNLLKWLLFDIWPNILFVDWAITKYSEIYSIQETRKVQEWSNPLYWYSLNNRVRKYQRKCFLEFLNKYDFSLQYDINRVLVSKARELYQFPH